MTYDSYPVNQGINYNTSGWLANNPLSYDNRTMQINGNLTLLPGQEVRYDYTSGTITVTTAKGTDFTAVSSTTESARGEEEMITTGVKTIKLTRDELAEVLGMTEGETFKSVTWEAGSGNFTGGLVVTVNMDTVKTSINKK